MQHHLISNVRYSQTFCQLINSLKTHLQFKGERHICTDFNSVPLKKTCHSHI